MSKKSAVSNLEEAPWRDVSRVGAAEGKPNGGRTLVARSRAHVAIETTEVFGGERCQVHQGKERDSHRACIRRKVAKLCWTVLLGTLLLCTTDVSFFLTRTSRTGWN